MSAAAGCFAELPNQMRRFPVLLTMCHMGVCSIMAYAVSKLGITPKHQLKSTAQLYKVCPRCPACASTPGASSCDFGAQLCLVFGHCRCEPVLSLLPFRLHSASPPRPCALIQLWSESVPDRGAEHD